MSKTRVAIAVFALCLACTACSESKSPQASHAAQTADSSVTAVLSIDPCGGLTPAQAASILHIPLADVIGPAHLKTFSCSYHVRDNNFKHLDFNVYPSVSPAAAARKLGAIKENLGFLSSSVAVANLGDEAWYFPDSRAGRLLVRKNAVWLDVTTPGDKDSQVHIAKIVLTNLP